MFLPDKHVAVDINQIICQTTYLSARSTIGTAPETMLRSVATSAIAHTECPMDEHFQFDVGGMTDFLYLIQRQLTRKNDTLETKRGQGVDMFRRTVVHLRTGV